MPKPARPPRRRRRQIVVSKYHGLSKRALEERLANAEALVEMLQRMQEGDPDHRYATKTVDVLLLRRRLKMTRARFARRFGFKVGTLRHWERGDRAPSAPSLILLNLINRNPQAALQLLRTRKLPPLDP